MLKSLLMTDMEKGFTIHAN